MHLNTPPNRTISLIVFFVLVIGVIAALYLAGKQQDIRQRASSSFTCTNAPGQACSSNPCGSGLEGIGSCQPGTYCCKVSPQTAVSTNSGTVSFVSDIPSLTISDYKEQQILDLLNSINYFQPNEIGGHTSAGSLQNMSVQRVIVHLTNTLQPYGQFIAGDSGQKTVLFAYSDTYDASNQTQTLYLYLASSILGNDTNTISNQYTQVFTHVIWELTHPIKVGENVQQRLQAEKQLQQIAQGEQILTITKQ